MMSSRVRTLRGTSLPGFALPALLAVSALSAALALPGCAPTPVPSAQDAPTLAADSLRTLAAARPGGEAAQVIGIDGRYGGHAWLGIRYAQAPTGPLRWRAPVPAAPEGRLEARAHGAACPQFANPMGGVTTAEPGTLVGEEDCLFLNVYAPAAAPAARPVGEEAWPVMVWIHGGGNTIGTSSFYEGSRLASEQGVVVVTVNYRLGPLGWLRHPSLGAHSTGPADVSGNFGILDLELALEWVRDHAKHFGGDPGNVTIFGESAGAWNVLALMAAPGAEGLFHRAIAQSPVVWSAPPDAAEAAGADAPNERFSSGDALLALIEADGLAADRTAARALAATWTPERTAAFLRGRSIEQFFSVYQSERGALRSMALMFEDGRVLPDRPLALVLRDPEALHRVPILLGSNRDEQKVFYYGNPEYVKQWFGVLPQLLDRERFLRDTEAGSRMWKLVGVDEIAAALAPAWPGEVFAYRFDWDEEPTLLWVELGELLGASHGFEIPFVFGHWDLGPAGTILFDDDNLPGREALSSAMRSYWAEFARHGSPGRGREGDLAQWRAWGAAGELFATLDTPAGGGIAMSGQRETLSGLVSHVLEDPRYASRDLRCDALAALSDWAPHRFGDAAVASAGGGLCAGGEPQDVASAAE